MTIDHVTPLKRRLKIDISHKNGLYRSAIHYLGTVHTGPTGTDRDAVEREARKRADLIADAPPSPLLTNVKPPKHSEFEKEYEKRGFTDVIVLDSEFKQSASSHWESSTEIAIGKKSGKCFKLRVYESINFLKRQNDSLDFSEEGISEEEYERLAKEAQER